MVRMRVVLGLIAAAAFILVLGPMRRFAQRRGSPVLRQTPVVLHRLLGFALGVRVRVHGRPAGAARRLLVPNHVSWLDIPILGAIEPMAFLAKKEIGAKWLGRELAALQGMIYVDRQRKRAIPKVNADMATAMRAGEPVVLFAEATTSDGNRVLRFRSSHFEAVRAAAADGAPAVVQPVFLHYSRLAGLPVTRAQRPRIAWYGDMTFWPHLRDYLGCGGLICDVHYGDPIPASAFADRKQLSRATERSLRALAAKARSAVFRPEAVVPKPAETIYKGAIVPAETLVDPT